MISIFSEQIRDQKTFASKDQVHPLNVLIDAIGDDFW